MRLTTRARARRFVSAIAVAVSAGLLSGCVGSQTTAGQSRSHKSKEYFPESVWGVKASPRVSFKKSNLPRGGGRDQVGKPYKVRGKTYYPKEDKNYKKIGKASWYGDAFHGRLTANGEVYDMTHLTAAHPTMPLPSYARVTNLENGSSVIVRVNDRGPYSHNRVIDLSSKAADMLDYKHHGTAKVKVEYVGRAPLDGRDDQYLLASYRPGNKAPDPGVGLPTGVMIAMNGSTPTDRAGKAPAAAFPGMLRDVAPQQAAPVLTASATAPQIHLDLPAIGPIAPERPRIEDIIMESQVALAMSYAPEPVRSAASAFDLLDRGGTAATAGALDEAEAAEPFVAAGTYGSREEASKVSSALAAFGTASIEVSGADGSPAYSVVLRRDGRADIDAMLMAAWSRGAPEAIVVRD